MSDTVGLANPGDISYIFNQLIPEFKDINIGAHFHSATDNWEEKIQAAYNSGCLRYDSAINGIGGCPMAEDVLVGNIATENILYWCQQNNIELNINLEAFAKARKMAGRIFI
jgi:hydroxymethylglutaryl-CoA lyase